MKHLRALFLALTLAALLIGCGTPNQPEETTGATTDGTKVVSSVDELLTAIAPDTEILLEEGEYLLSEAGDYGQQSTNPYYEWKDLGLGEYELQLQNLKNLTIRGSGSDFTTLSTDPRYANVLSLSDCENVNVEAVTLGHTNMAEACEGGVVRLERCQEITLDGVELYGCGSLGLHTFQCQDVTLMGSSIYECSVGGVSLCDTTNVDIHDCSIHSIGKETEARYLVEVIGGENISVSNCELSDNITDGLISVNDGSNVVFRENRFAANQVNYDSFDFQSEVILDNNTFEDNQVGSWYAANSLTAKDGEGKAVVFDEEQEEEPTEVTPGVAVPVSTGEQKEVCVSTVDEFLQALAPDTCIILEGELFDFSTASEYGTGKGEYYKWVDNFDGPGLVISNVSNMTIMAEGEDRTAHTLSAMPRYADVLTFQNCSAITLSGFTAGHTKEKGSCTGGVLLFENCEDVLVENCGLFGCGTEGVNGSFSRNIQVVNSEIYECSISGIELTQCENVAISGTLIRDIGDEYGARNFFRFYDNKNVTLDGEALPGSYHGN